MAQTFTDGIWEISISGGMVRMDLFVQSMERKGDDGAPEPEIHQRLIMHPQAFLNMFGVMKDMMGRLEDQGLITRADAQRAEQPGTAPAKPAGPSSPNF